MKYFIYIKGLAELEVVEKWEEARITLLELWNSNRESVDILCRIISECWYVLFEWDCNINTDELDFDNFKTTLIEVTVYGLDHCNSDHSFLWIAGYMISLFPSFFYYGNSDDEYVEWENRGVDMLSRSVQLQPNNLVAKTLYLGSKGITDEYDKTKKELQPVLKGNFSGGTAIEKYFLEVLAI